MGFKVCGFIFSIPLSENGTFLIKENFEQAFDSISYRGPDEHEIYQIDSIESGFHRLAIIDEKNSSQPYKSHFEDIVIYFNGFISNYKELEQQFNVKVRSDTELLLKLYLYKGVCFIDDIKGMYSIVLFDKKKQSVYFFRDKYGIKPLYYYLDENIMCICSEMKALNLLTEKINLDIDAVLSDSRVTMNQKNSRIIKSFTKEDILVEPGILYRFSLTSHRLSKEWFWKFEPLTQQTDNNKNTEGQVINIYKEKFKKSIVRNLMKDDDIEYSLMLSGGIDSTSILSEIPSSLHCFTIKNKATELNGETIGAKKTADFYHLKLNEVNTDAELEKVKNKANFYKDLLWITESPLMSAEHILKFFLFKSIKETNSKIKIVFSGQGSDEFNGGYSTLPATAEDWDSFIEYLEIKDYIGNDMERDYWNNNYSEFVKFEVKENYYYDYLKSMYVDLIMYNCHFEDRLASFWGLENRVPFLDYDLVNFSINLSPKHQKLLYDKKILRRSLEKKLPPHIKNKEKTPFYFGEGEQHIRNMMLEFFKYNNYQLLKEISDNQHEFNNLTKSLEFNFSKDRAIEPFIRYINVKLLKKMFAERKTQPTYLKELYKL
ncbi:asparagine synthetase B [Staphylococcus chromogenes]|uniref:asparagine synthetase B family protein n=1 Tax=Staphylococcus chromogenes TaxID=46126 RepID=UPI002DB7A86C|nr:asparagine synthetase B [Staphylococcus chromogenes]MEB7433233.1 asparagine synthetase B [Staphylococcus chromogenes]